MKSLLTGLIFTGCASFAWAHPVNSPIDTTKQENLLRLAPSPAREYPLRLVQTANVNFPHMLAEHADESIAYIEKYSDAHRAYIQRLFKDSRKFFPKVEKILAKYEVPAEFRVLMAIESGFYGKAVSPAGAVGYWQIMDEVAREYGMKLAPKPKAVAVTRKIRVKKGRKTKTVTELVKLHKPDYSKDDRTNFIKSTQVAARYLRDRCRNLNNDWLLIAASYNCGVGNVWNAMQRSGKENPTFWDVKKFLPQETQYYVMNFITLNVIFSNYETFLKDELCFRDQYCIDEESCTDNNWTTDVSCRD
jgi:soluble lytic murein transglycosylase-like protein